MTNEPKQETNMVKIQVGDEIWIDKGRLGSDSGEVLSINGFSIGGFNGTYFSNSEGREKGFDQTVHNISKIDKQNTATQPQAVSEPTNQNDGNLPEEADQLVKLSLEIGLEAFCVRVEEALTNARREERERIKRCMFPVIDLEAQSSEENL